MAGWFGGTFYDFLDGPWDAAKGYLKEHLEQLTIAISTQVGEAFNSDNTLTERAIGGSPAPVPSYVANTGPRRSPRWDKVDVASGVKNRLRYVNLTAATTGSLLLGRGSGAGGNWQEITLEPLYQRMNGTTLTFSKRAASAIELELHHTVGSLDMIEAMI